MGVFSEPSSTITWVKRLFVIDRLSSSCWHLAKHYLTIIMISVSIYSNLLPRSFDPIFWVFYVFSDWTLFVMFKFLSFSLVTGFPVKLVILPVNVFLSLCHSPFSVWICHVFCISSFLCCSFMYVLSCPLSLVCPWPLCHARVVIVCLTVSCFILRV